MYAYFIDEEASVKYKRDLDRLDLSLTSRGITGRKMYLNRLSDLGRSVRECLAAGVKTFVAVGNDSAVSRLVNVVASLPKEDTAGIALGVLPVGEPRLVARSLGCAEFAGAVETLARRHVLRMDLGVLNGRHRFLGAAIFPKNVSLSFLSYRVSSLRRDHHISVCSMNIYSPAHVLGKRAFNPSDGVLEAVIAYRLKASRWPRLWRSRSVVSEDFVPESVFPIRDITVTSKQNTIAVMADAEKRLSTPVVVGVEPGALSVVVGNRFGAQ